MFEKLRIEWQYMRPARLWLGLSAFFCVSWVVSVVLFFCWGQWLMFRVLLPLVEHLNPGIDAPDNWAVGLTYFIKFVAILAGANVVFLVIAAWQVSRKQPRESEQAR